jgi:hypothetical protein
MANIVNTHFKIDSMNKEASTFLTALLGGESYKEWHDTMWFFNKLYGDKKYDRTDYIDKMGAKWCYITEIELGDDYCVINLESAWYPPIEALEELTKILHQFDNDILMTYQFEDENIWGTHGGGAGTKGKFARNESELDEDKFGEEPDWEDSDKYEDWNESVRDGLDNLQADCITDAIDELTK